MGVLTRFGTVFVIYHVNQFNMKYRIVKSKNGNFFIVLSAVKSLIGILMGGMNRSARSQ